MGSSIHPEHIEIFHKQNHEGIKNFWIQNGVDLSIDKLMAFDPYLGRITEQPQQPPQ